MLQVFRSSSKVARSGLEGGSSCPSLFISSRLAAGANIKAGLKLRKRRVKEEYKKYLLVLFLFAVLFPLVDVYALGVPRSPIEVTLETSGPLRPGETVQLKILVTSSIDAPEIAVSLSVPNGISALTPTTWTVALQAGESVVLFAKIYAERAGKFRVSVVAKQFVSEQSWVGGSDSIWFFVDTLNPWFSKKPLTPDETRYAKPAVKVPEQELILPQQLRSLWAPEPTPYQEQIRPEPGEPIPRLFGDDVKVKGAGYIKIKGRLSYYNSNGELQPCKWVTVWIYDNDIITSDDYLGAVLTDKNGYFETDWLPNSDGEGGGQDIYVVFVASCSAASVKEPNGNYYDGWTDHETHRDVPDGSIVDVGSWRPPDSEKEAWWIYETLLDGWAYLRSFGYVMEEANACYPCGDWPGYYLGGQIYIPDVDAAASPDVILHEYGHNVMYVAYGHTFPDANCPDPHYINGASNASCAWTEGWATFFALAATNDPIDTYVNHYSIDMESPYWQSYSTGDTVEGNVAAALWDIFDYDDDGYDDWGDDFDGIWDTFEAQNDETFAEFWHAWLSRGHNGHYAVQSIYENTIDYDSKPTIAGVPNQYIDNGSTVDVDLFPYTDDLESSDTELSFSVVQNSNSFCVTASIYSDRYLHITSIAAGCSSNITVEVNDGIKTDTDTIEVSVSEANPALCKSTSSLDFGTSVTSKTFEVWNCGGGTLSYTISDDREWIVVSPTSGSSTGEHDTITVTVNRSGLSPGHYTGTVTIDPNYGANQTVTVSMDVSNNPPNTPTNQSPCGVSNVSLTPTLQASSFSDPDGDSFANSQWQVNDSSAFSSPVWDSGTYSPVTSVTVPSGKLTYNITYWWRVRYKDSRETWSDWSSPCSFTTQPAPNNPPNTPTLVSPANGATGLSLIPMLQASAFSDPDGDGHANSHWQVDNNNDFSSPEWDSGETYAASTSTTVPSGRLSYGTTYWWRVRYKDSRGAWSSWSSPRYFTTQPGIEPQLCVTPDPPDHDFGKVTEQVTWSFQIKNCGQGTLNWSVSTANCPGISFNPSEGLLGAGEMVTVTVTLDPHGLEIKTYECTLAIESNGGQKSGTIKFTIGEPTSTCWQQGTVQIQAHGSASDSDNWFGVDPNAMDCFDVGYDAEEPPPGFPPFTSLYFELDPSCSDTKKLTKDIRSSIPCGGYKAWTMRVKDEGNATKVTISWDPTQLPPPGSCSAPVTVTLRDNVTGETIDMRTSATHTYTKRENPEIREFTITVSCRSCVAKQHLLSPASWHMIALPGNLCGECASVFGNLVCALRDDLQSCYIFHYDPQQGGYVMAPPPENIPYKAGLGFWVRTYQDEVQIDAELEPVASPVEVHLKKGWMQLGNPYDEAISIEGLQVRCGNTVLSLSDAAAQGWVSPYLFLYDPVTRSYRMLQATDSIPPWAGFWFLSYVDSCALIINQVAAPPPPPSQGVSSIDLAMGIELPPPPPSLPEGAGQIRVVPVPNPIRDVKTTTFRVLGVCPCAVQALRVEIYDLAGRLVWEGEIQGSELAWHTEGFDGLPLANGVYLYKAYVKVNGEWIPTGVGKVVVLR